jgi:ribosome recycling factor
VAEDDITSMTNDLERRMEGATDVLHREFSGLRTGRASTGLLEHVQVEAYGSRVPLNQVGNVSVPDSRMLTVQVWDKGLVKAVEKGIVEAGLGLNPAAEGQVIRVPIPALTEERRTELSKVAGKYAEEARVAARNVRRHGMDELKRLEKDGEMSKDEQHKVSQIIQNLTNRYIEKIDELLANKEQEIMQV